MNNGKYVFAQLLSFLSYDDFNKWVKKYRGNYKVKGFSCWHQLLCMLFGQFSQRQSLRDLIVCLKSQRSKWYHLGLGTSLSRSNLAYSNERRDWRIFSGFAYQVIARARNTCQGFGELDVPVTGQVYAIDSSTIDLCLSVFWWAKFRRQKGAVKLHTQYDIKTDIPNFIHITDGKRHDVHFLDSIIYELGAFYIMDRAYIDFKRLYTLHKASAWFVTRSKTHLNFRRVYSHPKDKAAGIKCDQTIKLNNFYASRYYPEKLRRIKYYDATEDRTLEFITNNFELTATQIAKLYQYRWKIELFFKWIKQHLKIKVFWGHSENAVRIQIYTAIIAYCLVAIIREKLQIKHSRYEMLQILSLTLLNKTPLNQLFNEHAQQNLKEPTHNQLNLF